MKTVKVKIAVAVDPTGKWSASGWSMQNGEPAEREAMDIAIDGVDEGEVGYWLEAEVPIPETEIISAKVLPADT